MEKADVLYLIRFTLCLRDVSAVSQQNCVCPSLCADFGEIPAPEGRFVCISGGDISFIED
jgi:hypothetical protein